MLVAKISHKPQGQVHLDDGYLIALAKQGNADAYDRLVRRYYSFVRLKASSYFLIGGSPSYFRLRYSRVAANANKPT